MITPARNRWNGSEAEDPFHETREGVCVGGGVDYAWAGGYDGNRGKVGGESELGLEVAEPDSEDHCEFGVSW